MLSEDLKDAWERPPVSSYFQDRGKAIAKLGRVRHGFIKIVDAPDEPSFSVAPSTKVLDMQITNSQYARGTSFDLTPILPELNPAIERGPHESEG